jgi:hypothetical protein
MKTILSDSIEKRWWAYKILKNFYEDTADIWGLSIQKAFKAKKIYQAEIWKLIKSGDVWTDAYSTLVKWVQQLNDSIDESILKSMKWPKFAKWKKQYASLKKIATDISKSAAVEWRRSPQTFVEQLWTLNAIIEWVSNPLSTARNLFAKEIWELNTRGGAWKELIKIYDTRAIKAKPTKKLQKSSSKVNPEKTSENLTLKKESATMGDMENPIVNKQTWETLNQAIEKLRKNNWSEKDISKFRESVLWKKENIVKKEWVLDTVNPTGWLFVDYTPSKRANSIISSKALTTLDKTLWKSPDDYITIYRGTVKWQKEMNPWDFVTDLPELAKSYAGWDKIVISKRVKYSDIIDSIEDWWANEYLYIPKEMQKWDNK